VSAPTDPTRLPAGLYVVGTPIGNREDLSPRAAEVLLGVDAIACEDTRHAARLLDPLGATAHRLVYHEHNEQREAPQLAARIADGARIALITDAGMPGISDPGFRLVRLCRARGLPVFAVPGPSAFATAVAVSGLPTDGILFLGFLPPKRAARERIFERFRDFEYTLVFYESTHRIAKTLDDIVSVLGPERCISVAKELTKLHERVVSGPAGAVRDAFGSLSLKGEFVVSVAKAGYELGD